MDVLSADQSSQRQLAIIERFEGFVNYTYPIAIDIRRSHHVVRDRHNQAMFEQVSLFQQAGKSSQISKLYLADAGLAHLRFLLRFLADANRRLISRHQHEVAATHAQWANSFNLLNKLGVA